MACEIFLPVPFTATGISAVRDGFSAGLYLGSKFIGVTLSVVVERLRAAGLLRVLGLGTTSSNIAKDVFVEV